MTLIPASLRGSSQTPTQPLKMKWDFENKLLAADTNNDNTDDVFYKFDALGRRVARTANSATTIYFQSGQQTIADYASGAAASSPTYSYIYASYVDEPVARFDGSGAPLFMHRNQQYSVTAVTDGSGAIVERYAYTAYGTPTISNASGTTRATTAIGNRYTYTGREWDNSLALFHYRARMYDPSAGRFCSRDPIGFEGSKWNLVEYASGQVLVGVDPTGKSWLSNSKKLIKRACGHRDPLPTADENCLRSCNFFQHHETKITCVWARTILKDVGCDNLIEACLRSGSARNPCTATWTMLCGDAPARP